MMMMYTHEHTISPNNFNKPDNLDNTGNPNNPINPIDPINPIMLTRGTMWG